MTVHKIAAGDSAAYVAYLASQGPERRCGDYYLGHEGRPAEGPSQWLGQGAVALGLAGEVGREDILSLWQGKDPRSGQQLVRFAHGVHTAAVDCTFSAPKSVAIVWVLGDQQTRDRVELAHQQAVETALAHLEAHPAVAASTLLEQAELAAAAPEPAELVEELEQEPEAESETAPEQPEPHRELEPGWTLVDEPEQGAERE